jgi:DNA-binding response OmpR family regulator
VPGLEGIGPTHHSCGKTSVFIGDSAKTKPVLGKGPPMAQKVITVLLVEDEDHIRTVVEYNLKHEGFDVYKAEDGAGGLELARRVLPDVILLDWMMPEMDGLEVLTELKRDKSTAHIPVFMLTAKGMAGDMEKTFELGADDYITKPFDPRLLGRTIRRKLNGRMQLDASTPGAVQEETRGCS